MKLKEKDCLAFAENVMKDWPRTDYEAQAWEMVEPVVVAAMPEKIRAIYEDKELSGALAKCFIRLPANMPALYKPIGVEYKIEEDSDLWDDLRLIASKHDFQDGLRRKYLGVLRNTLFQYRTLAEAREGFEANYPELLKYLPDERKKTADREPEPKAAPLYPNLVADLQRAGWKQAVAIATGTGNEQAQQNP
jgi:hypothetical protein